MSDEKRDRMEKARKDWMLEVEKLQIFWKDEYPNLSLDDRKKYWFKKLYRRVYWDGASENADLSVFNKNTYKKWKKIDREMDVIMDYVIEALDTEFGASGMMKEKIEDILGRNK